LVAPLEAEKATETWVDADVKKGSREIHLSHPCVGVEASQGVVISGEVHLVMREARVDVAGAVEVEALFRKNNASVLLIRCPYRVDHQVSNLRWGGDGFYLALCEESGDLSVDLFKVVDGSAGVVVAAPRRNEGVIGRGYR
jgi:hypothetical protein